MKACVISSYNSPWQLMDVTVPEPQEGEVLIKIHASGLCGTDLHVTHGMFPLKLPVIPGHEPVGEIVKLGAGVTDLKMGDRVGVCWHQKGCGRCFYCEQDRDLYCQGYPNGAITWMQMGGGMAEYMIAKKEGCILIPDSLDYVDAAPLFCAGYTIASGYHNAEPKPGEVICVLGIGGLGHLAIQYAKAKGHKVIAITEHEDKQALCKQLGADQIIAGSKNPGFSLKEWGGADIILDCSNSNEMAQNAILGLKPEGRFVIMGIDQKPLTISNIQLIHLQTKIIGSTQNRRSDLIDILRLAAEGKIKPMIEIFSLSEHEKALNLLKSGKIHFRAVFKIV
jgi:alcohol dehydrogenase